MSYMLEFILRFQAFRDAKVNLGQSTQSGNSPWFVVIHPIVGTKKVIRAYTFNFQQFICSSILII